MMISTLASNFAVKPSLSPLKTSSISRRHTVLSHQQTLSSFPSKIQDFNPKPSLTFLTLPGTRLGLSRNGKSEFHVNAGDGGEGGDVDEAERLARGESTMPERFRYLTKEAPDPPVRWPFFVALAFLLYAWKAVLFELSNWRKAAFAVLAIAEATVPNSISCQPYMLTVSGLIGYAAVTGYISEPLYWTLLLGLYGFSRIIKKRDDVTSALPVAAVMAAIGEPWVRILVITSYLALAIFHHSSKITEQTEGVATEKRLPMPLLGAALAIGIHLAAKWAGYRHLTWMIV
ncbi:hypothetical protein PTKIN_Ptkin04bG0234300 [Pterospermum kingtungense]